ncbi:unnamed protein product [Rotaria magnacalcarata]
MEFEVAKVNSNKCTHDNSINVIIPEELQYEQILFRKYSTTMVNGTIMNMDNNSYDPLVENAQLTMFCETRSERSVESKRKNTLSFLTLSRNIRYYKYNAINDYVIFNPMLASRRIRSEISLFHYHDRHRRIIIRQVTRRKKGS